jgi:hypothetical protein
MKENSTIIKDLCFVLARERGCRPVDDWVARPGQEGFIPKDGDEPFKVFNQKAY